MSPEVVARWIPQRIVREGGPMKNLLGGGGGTSEESDDSDEEPEKLM